MDLFRLDIPRQTRFVTPKRHDEHTCFLKRWRRRCLTENRELKQRRRRRGRRQVKREVGFYKRNSTLFRSVRYAKALKKCLSETCNDGVQIQMHLEIRKISRRRPRAVDDGELGHSTSLFCRARQRNVQRFKTHVHSYCSAHQTFCLVTFPV